MKPYRHKADDVRFSKKRQKGTQKVVLDERFRRDLLEDPDFRTTAGAWMRISVTGCSSAL